MKRYLLGNYFHFGSRYKLKQFRIQWEYLEIQSGTRLLVLEQLKNTIKNEESNKTESVRDSNETTPDYTESVSGYKESQEEGDEFVIE